MNELRAMLCISLMMMGICTLGYNHQFYGEGFKYIHGIVAGIGLIVLGFMISIKRTE